MSILDADAVFVSVGQQELWRKYFMGESTPQERRRYDMLRYNRWPDGTLQELYLGDGEDEDQEWWDEMRRRQAEARK